MSWYKKATKGIKRPEEFFLGLAIDYQEGMGFAEICKKHNTSPGTVYKALKMFNIPQRDDTERRRNLYYDLDTRTKIAEDIRSGKSYFDLFTAYGCPPRMVKSIENEFNVKYTGGVHRPYRENNVENRILSAIESFKDLNGYVNTSDISRQFGVSTSIVTSILRENGLGDLIKSFQKRPIATELEYLEISELYTSGYGAVSLADEYFVSYVDLRRRLIESDLWDTMRSNSKYRPLTREQLEEIARLALNTTVKDLAEQYNVKRGWLRKKLDLLKVPTKIPEIREITLDRARMSHSTLQPESWETFNQQIRDGILPPELARMYGVSYDTILDWSQKSKLVSTNSWYHNYFRYS